MLGESSFVSTTATRAARGRRALARELLISGEDHRFFSHGGIDLLAVCRAVCRGAGKARARSNAVVARRKAYEVALATLVNREVPKEALPAFYLRLGYFGWRMNGFAAACRRVGASRSVDADRHGTTGGVAEATATLPFSRARGHRSRHPNNISFNYAQYRHDGPTLGLARRASAARIPNDGDSGHADRIGAVADRRRDGRLVTEAEALLADLAPAPVTGTYVDAFYEQNRSPDIAPERAGRP